MADPIKLKAARPPVGALDRAMAAFLAAAVGFVLFVVPADLLPIAGPAMGGARLLIAIFGGTATFLAVAALLRALNKPAPARARKSVEAPNEPPRLRRADAHPDAPARSPILAGSELGVPLDDFAINARRPAADLQEVENVDFDAEWERPLPGFIDEDARPEETEPVAWEPVEELAEPLADRADDSASSPTSAEIPFWMPEGAAPPEPVEEAPVAQSTEPSAPAEDVPLAVPFRGSRARAAARPAGSESLDALSKHLPSRGDEGASLDSMVERFETGLGQRPRPSRRGKDADAAIDQRLRSALGDLKKMAGRR